MAGGRSVSAVQREVAKLEDMGLVRSEVDDRGRRLIHLVAEHPFADPLAGLVAAEVRAEYSTAIVSADCLLAGAPAAGLLNPRVRGMAGMIAKAARRYGATRIALFGSATENDAGVVPRDLDVAVRFDPGDARSRAELYFGLRDELERISGMRVDLVETDAVENPYLREAIAQTEVVLLEIA